MFFVLYGWKANDILLSVFSFHYSFRLQVGYMWDQEAKFGSLILHTMVAFTAKHSKSLRNLPTIFSSIRPSWHVISEEECLKVSVRFTTSYPLWV
jgi:hypothetical protein